MSQTRPIRALHFLHRLHTGGVGAWMIQILRRQDRDRVQHDVAVQDEHTGMHEAEAAVLGTQIFRCTRPKRLWQYVRQVQHVLRAHGPYDVVHAHMGHWSGLLLRIAAREGVPVRIAHSRLDVGDERRHAPAPWGLYYHLMDHLLDRNATHWWAVSEAAGVGQFGQQWHYDARAAIVRSGIDLSPFSEPCVPERVRSELNLPAKALVMGHVGRFTAQKNHDFLVRLFAALVEREPNAQLVLIGDGELRPAVERRIRELGLGEHVHLLGPRDDVARLLRGAIDVVALPSSHEGLPRVALEAQAAGVPLVVATAISPELAVVPEAVHWRELDEPPVAWAQTIFSAGRAGLIDADAALHRLEQSAFNIDTNIRQLEQYYFNALQSLSPIVPTSAAPG